MMLVNFLTPSPGKIIVTVGVYIILYEISGRHILDYTVSLSNVCFFKFTLKSWEFCHFYFTSCTLCVSTACATPLPSSLSIINSFYTKSSTCIFTLLTNIDSFFLPHKFYIKPSTCVTTPSPHPTSRPPPVKYWYFISFHTSSTLSLSTLCYSHLHIFLVDNFCLSTHVIVISLGKIYKIHVNIYCLDIWHLYRDSTQHKFLSFFWVKSSQFCQKKTIYTYLYF